MRPKLLNLASVLAVLFVLGIVVFRVADLTLGVDPATDVPSFTPDPGPPQEPGPNVPVAQPLPSADTAACEEVADLRGRGQLLDSKAAIDTYISSQDALLKRRAETTPDKPGFAGVDLVKPVSGEELDGLLRKYSLTWVNIYWEAGGGVHGATYNTGDDRSFTERIRTESGLGSDAGLSYYYFTVNDVPLSQLVELAKNPLVLLVDLGRVEDREAAVQRGACVKFALPDPLRLTYDSLGIAP